MIRATPTAVPTQLQNFPDIARVALGGGIIVIDYSVPSTADNSAYPLLVDFYVADADGQEGKILLYSDTYGAAHATLTKRISFPVSMTATDRVVATATDFNGNTSEFSPAAPVVNGHPSLDLMFSDRTMLAGTGIPRNNVVLADMDGDHKTDILVNNGTLGNVSVYRNTATPGTLSTASFEAPAKFAAANPNSYVIAADLDGDEKPDVITANASASTVSVLRNTSSPGSLSFASKIDFNITAASTGLAAGDLDGDGRLDLVAVNNSADTVSVLRNTSSTGTISFAPPVDASTADEPYRVAISDLDGDGKVDVAVINAGASSVSVLRNLSTAGAISLASRVDFALGSAPRALAVGDLDRDLRPELVIALQNGSVAVLRNTSATGLIGPSSFASPVSFAIGSSAADVAIREVDGDFRPDVIVANPLRVTILGNLSVSAGINLMPLGSMLADGQPLSIALDDLDHGTDGRPDLVALNASDGSLTVWRNTASQLAAISPETLDIAFTIGDFETSPSLTVSATSSHQSLLPNSSISIIAGTGGARTLRIAPNAAVSGVATVTVTVTDPEGASAVTTQTVG